MSIDLLPCPFCGSEAQMVYDTHSDYERNWVYLVNCTDIECWAEGQSCTTLEAAAAYWNKRPIEDELRATILNLRQMIEAVSMY